jgi:hypothetical protein
MGTKTRGLEVARVRRVLGEVEDDVEPGDSQVSE